MREWGRRIAAVALAAPALASPLPSLSRTTARPAGIAPAIERTLAPGAFEVRDGSSLAATFWMRRDLPAASEEKMPGSPILEEGIAVRGIRAGSLVGAVSFELAWRDYRNRIVPPGLYTLRYLRQPAIKEHRGVSPFRDFLAITPASLDRDLDADPREAAERSAAGAGRGHPAVMALVPARGPERARVETGPGGEPVLAVSAGSLPLALVLAGHGRVDDAP